MLHGGVDVKHVSGQSGIIQEVFKIDGLIATCQDFQSEVRRRESGKALDLRDNAPLHQKADRCMKTVDLAMEGELCGVLSFIPLIKPMLVGVLGENFGLY